mmetsp:Transcript_9641/g.18723  ORF Transcript_9641/g.18723 Transcript_9641/m.18723 type:complete len:98 (+) Transcript_9641:49-342(+)
MVLSAMMMPAMRSLYASPNGGRNDPYSMYDTRMGGNWYKADEPWGAYLQGEGNPAVTIHPYESDPSSGSFNPQAHTSWVPVDWSSWPNYNVHGYGIY